MSPLKPCPFCGGDAKGEWGGACSDNPYVITCPGCPATMIAYGDSDDAIAAWNRRAGDAEVEKLRAELAAAREALRDARLQLEYLDSRWPTGTTPPILTRISTALGDTPMTGTLTDRWNNDEPDDPTAGQPDNPQQWRRDPLEPKKPPGYEDKPQRWHKD